MAGRPKPRGKWWSAIMVVVALGVWAYDQKNALQDPPPRRQTSAPARPVPSPPPSGATQRSVPAGQVGGYEHYLGCTLVENRQNDGDSFVIRLPGGREEIFRLYFVDCPESAFRTYAHNENNSERIRQQAADMGGITPEQAVELGQRAKHFTLDLLASQPFEIFTRWDSPFKDHRYHAHVQVMQNGHPRWLDELLMEQGLVRIKTKPADLPDGTSAAQHLEKLRTLRKR